MSVVRRNELRRTGKIPSPVPAFLPEAMILTFVIVTSLVSSFLVPWIQNLEVDQFFNLSEGVLWISISSILLWKAFKKTPSSHLLIGSSVTFLLFGVSDFIEITTRAWFEPWPLLALKGACVVSLLLHLGLYRKRRLKTDHHC